MIQRRDLLLSSASADEPIESRAHYENTATLCDGGLNTLHFELLSKIGFLQMGNNIEVGRYQETEKLA